MKLRYKCLILDHDDTAVNSTAVIHYPAHLEVMRVLRPDSHPINLDGWFLKNFHPGIMAYLTEELKLNKQEIQKEYQIWREFTTKRIPEFYPGFIEALSEYKKRGGLIAVISHSEKDLIERDYRSYNQKKPLLPDIIFGWDYNEKKRKPSPFPVKEILKTYNLKAKDALIIDDLKPGILMAQATGVPVAAAGWSHSIQKIRDFMKKNSLIYLKTIKDFRQFVLT